VLLGEEFHYFLLLRSGVGVFYSWYYDRRRNFSTSFSSHSSRRDLGEEDFQKRRYVACFIFVESCVYCLIGEMLTLETVDKVFRVNVCVVVVLFVTVWLSLAC
jgi:hypothetical protein